MFGYKFVDLTSEQVEARRKHLDQAGYQSYLAPIILLAGVYVYRKLISSPQYHSKSHPATRPSVVTVSCRRISWLLSTAYIPEFGPFHVQICGLLYTFFLVWRITYQTGVDYMHVTKAFGHVAASQLPMHYLLSLKWPKSPITLATGLTHERLNAYHRLFGRVIHALLATHAILYLRFFVKMDLLSKRIQHSDVRLGIIAFWSVNILGLLAIPPIRKRVYHRVFYRSHVLLSLLLLVVLWFHVKYTRIYVAQAAVLWLANGMLRTGASDVVRVKCETVGGDLVRVKAKVSGMHLFPYVPGCHVYLNKPGFGPRTPFTVVNAKALDGEETEVTLIAKNSHGPMTGALALAAKGDKELRMHLEGPYGEAQVYMSKLLEDASKGSGKFLLVAGGVGATYALPIYKALCDARIRSGASTKDIRLLWVVRKEEDVTWAGGFLATSGGEPSGIFINVTQPKKPETPSDEKALVVNKEAGGRPDFQQFVDDFFNEKLTKADGGLARDSKKADQVLYDTATVLVCGPPGLSRSLREAVGEHILVYGRAVRWYEEQFGFGGA